MFIFLILRSLREACWLKSRKIRFRRNKFFIYSLVLICIFVIFLLFILFFSSNIISWLIKNGVINGTDVHKVTSIAEVNIHAKLVISGVNRLKIGNVKPNTILLTLQ